MAEALEIERHRAAIARTDLSRPVRLAIEWAIINNDTTFFDYGCGYGGDVERLAARDYSCAGWDPYYRPDTPRNPADIVNLGYVLNVIEHPEERREALCQAWNITQKVLIVAAQVLISDRRNAKIVYGDGIVTRRNTFQKYYEQEELKAYIDEVLQVDAVPAALGIYFVFRDDTEKESFRALRFRSRSLTPRVRTLSKRFEDYQELLTPLIDFITERGRLPIKGELAETSRLGMETGREAQSRPQVSGSRHDAKVSKTAAQTEILLEFGTFHRAYNVILQATDEAEWDAIAYRRSLDILVYLALTQFSKRLSFNQLASELRQDIKAFFGTYQEACQVADKMLFSLGKPGVVAQTCKQSKIGKLLPTALYVHVSALPELDPLLRIYEGCASRAIGGMDNATLIKFYTDKPKISYLFYPNFDTEAHPALHTSMQIDLQNLSVVYREYDTVANPPILHRKETFVTPSYPLYERFAKLTRREEKLGLFKNTRTIGTRDGWQQALKENGVEIKGDRISKH